MHFLRKDECFGPHPLGRPYAAVHVRLETKGKGKAVFLRVAVPGEDESATSCIAICARDVLFIPLPDRVKVIGPDGKQLKPSRNKHFWVSVETFDPCHLILDASDVPIP